VVFSGATFMHQAAMRSMAEVVHATQAHANAETTK
jgi:hypothetical protein